MLAHLDDGVGAEGVAEPEVEGEVAVRRHEVGGVVGLRRVDVVAAGGLEAHDDVPEPVDRQREARAPSGAGPAARRAGGAPGRRSGPGGGAASPRTPLRSGAVCPVLQAARRHRAPRSFRTPRGYFRQDEERVGFGRSPARLDPVAQGRGQGGVVLEVDLERQDLAALAPDPVGEPVRRPGRQAGHQGLGRLGGALDAVALGGEAAEHGRRGGRGVEPHAVGQPPVAVGVVGQHQGHPALRARRAAQARPGGREVGHEGHAVGPGAVGRHGALRGPVEARLALERHRAGKDPAVHLRQRHVHGDVARREPRRPLGPGGLRGAREDHLEHRRAVGLGRRQRAAGDLRRARGEGRGVEDHRRRGALQEPVQRGDRERVLERRHLDRHRRHPAREECLGQAIRRLRPAAQQQRAVEHERDHRRPLGPERSDPVEARRGHAGPVQPRAQDGPRGGRCGGAVQHVGGVGQQARGVPGPALHEVGPERVVVLGADGGEPAQLRVGPVVAGQQRQRHAGLGQARRILLHAVGPVAPPAQHARDHQPRPRRAGVEVQVHRHRMAQVRQAREAQRRARGRAGMGVGEGGDLGVGGGEDHDVGRRLAEVDGLGPVVDGAGLRGEEVHQTGPPSPKSRSLEADKGSGP